MNGKLNRPERIAHWTLLAAEQLERCKHVCVWTGRADLALEFDEEIDRLRRLYGLVTSAGGDTQTFSRKAA